MLNNKNIKHKIVLVFLSVFFVFQTHAQCAMCRAVLENEEGHTAAEGINDGIVYLMAIPYILIAGIAFYIYKKYNTERR